MIIKLKSGDLVKFMHHDRWYYSILRKSYKNTLVATFKNSRYDKMDSYSIYSTSYIPSWLTKVEIWK